MTYRHAALYTLLTLSALAASASPLDVLNGEIDGQPAGEMMKRYLDNAAFRLLDERREQYEAVETPDDVRAYQQRMIDFFTKRIGGWPERTPLNAQVTGKGEKDGYRYENVLFESRPGLYVSSILFLPKTEPPYPGVIVPCGHSRNGKASEAYQRASILLALNGFAALCYDPPGQGQRYTYFKPDGSIELATTQHHTVVGVGCILTGTNMALFEIWDGMRAIDYLQSRDDIDPGRIGCTGNSGGGTQTSYIMALEPRVACAAPSCYLTSFERLLATAGPQDAEQDIYGQIAFGMDHAEYAIMRAPKPTLICAATQDFFDITGTWDCYRDAKRMYARLDASERCDIIEYDDKHGFSRPRRERAVQWMRRWLMGIDEDVDEPEFEILSDEEITAPPEEQVIHIAGARTINDYNVLRAERFAEQRQQFWQEQAEAEQVSKVRELIAARPYSAVNQPEATSLGSVETGDMQAEKLLLRPEEGIVLPALLFGQTDAPEQLAVYCDGKNKREAMAADGPVADLVEAGYTVLAVDLRGIGETASDESHKGWGRTVGPDWTDYYRAYLIEKSFVGMRVEDIFAAAKYLRDRFGDAPALDLIATGEATVPALHAAFLEKARFRMTRLSRGIPSWKAVVAERRAHDQLINCVHATLEWYDLPDMADALGPDKVSITETHLPTF